MYYATLIALVVGSLLSTYQVASDIDLFEAIIAYLQRFEHYDLDEIILFYIIVLIGLVIDLFRQVRRRNREIVAYHQQLVVQERERAELQLRVEQEKLAASEAELANEKLRHREMQMTHENQLLQDITAHLSIVMRAVSHIIGDAFNVIALVEKKFENGTLDQKTIDLAVAASRDASVKLRKFSNLENARFVKTENGYVLEFEHENYRYANGVITKT